ncbi:MAG: hypothetical protein GY824_01885, partial [Delftia sp.]|nr:hypothetical protein [Delftia sp.]
SGADVEADVLRSKRIETERNRERARQIEIQALAQTAQKQEWAVQRELDLGVEEEERARHMRLEAERRRLRAMHEAEMEHARQQLDNIISPFDEVFQQLRSQIHQDVSAIAASIEKNGHLRGKVATRARSLVDTFRLLNAHGDEDLENALDALKDRLPTQRPTGAKTRYDTGAVLSQLGQIKEMTHQAATDVAQRAARPTRARALEL